jgi:hypothetical protein
MRVDFPVMRHAVVRLSLLCSAATLPTACAPATVDGTSGTEEAVVRRWLLCEECVHGELQALQDPSREVPIVRALALGLAGPPRSRRENVRRQLEETYQQLAARAAERGANLPLTREQYVAHYLGNYEASYQSRAVIGLARIGSPEARRILAEAVERVRTGQAVYRGDVLEELGLATGAAVVGASALWTTITAGSFHTCGLRTDQRAYCWGRNDVGQLGDSTDMNRSRPVRVAGGLTFTQIVASVGGRHTCALAGDRAYCWGGNARGALGDSTETDRRFPTRARGGTAFAQLAVGANHTCALTFNNEAYCWGGNEEGQLGDGSTDQRTWPSPAADSLRFRTIAAGGAHTCADSLGGRVYCWGADQNGQLGDGKADFSRPVPGVTHPALRLTKLDLGDSHTCALTSTGPRSHDAVAYCVGRNEDSQLGDGTLTPRDSLKRVAGGNRFIAISAGNHHTCAIAVGTRKMLCWGDNSSGQLGNATSADQPTPVAVSGDLSFAVVSAGEGYTCGVTVQGTAYCWGQNLAGQLGDGSLANQDIPVQVLAP